MKIFAYIFAIFWIIMASFIFWTINAEANGKIYQPKDPKYGPPKSYSRQQKINRNETKKIKYTTCRLLKIIKSKSGRQACIYRGGNKTFELMYENNCLKQFKCVYNPWSKEPNIDDIIDSLNSIKK